MSGAASGFNLVPRVRARLIRSLAPGIGHQIRTAATSGQVPAQAELLF